MSNQVFVVFGSHLFSASHLTPYKTHTFFMKEDHGLCQRYQVHKHKLVFFLASMREYAEELRDKDYRVDYHFLEDSDPDTSFLETLREYLEENEASGISHFEIEDRFMREALKDLCEELKIEEEVLPSPMFLTSSTEFGDYLEDNKPFMKTFYEKRRNELSLLMEAKGKPVGGKWSFDSENRRKLPKEADPPDLPSFRSREISAKVCELVESQFGDHPGSTENFWLGTTREQAKYALKKFVEERLRDFGAYQDALTDEHPFVFHSVLSPYLNNGLLTPDEVLEAAIEHWGDGRRQIPINSIEGFVRQVMGWREFVYGIDFHFGEKQGKDNFWKHKRKLGPQWWDGSTGIPPLDGAIKKAVRFGYTHHIERLMVVGNLMLLCQVDPKEVFRWFMEFHVDSADWVMGPNVYGMSQFSDGGIFATKPYICGSNYFRKMGRFEKGEWCDVVDGLYWSFVDRHQGFFRDNPRMGMMSRMLDKLETDRKERIFSLAEEFTERVTKA